MSLSTDYMKTPSLDHLFVLDPGFPLMLFHKFLIDFPCLNNLLVIRLKESVDIGKDLIVIALFLHFILCHMVRISTKDDVSTSTGHICCYCYRPKSTCLCNYFSLPLMLLGVKDLMPDPFLL